MPARPDCLEEGSPVGPTLLDNYVSTVATTVSAGPAVRPIARHSIPRRSRTEAHLPSTGPLTRTLTAAATFHVGQASGTPSRRSGSTLRAGASSDPQWSVGPT